MKRLIFIIILLPAFIIGASADLDAAARDAGIYGVEDSLTDDARDISGKLDITGGYDTGSALGRLWRRFLDYLSSCMPPSKICVDSPRRGGGARSAPWFGRARSCECGVHRRFPGAPYPTSGAVF